MRAWGVCARRVHRCGGEGHAARGAGGAGTHDNERKGAAWVDCDASGAVELCVGAVVVVLDALCAAAGEGGGRPGGDVDTADPVVAIVLRCIKHEHTLSEVQASGAGWLLRAPL